LDDLGRLVCFLGILPAEVLGELKKGSLGSWGSELFGPRVGVFGGDQVGRDWSVGRVLRPGGEGGVGVVLFGGKIVGVFAIHLGFVGGVGGIVCLGCG